MAKRTDIIKNNTFMGFTINGKPFGDYFAEQKRKYGVLQIKKATQVMEDGVSSYRDCELVPSDGAMEFRDADVTLVKNGKSTRMRGHVRFVDGVWYVNGKRIEL